MHSLHDEIIREENIAKVELCHACTHLYAVGKVRILSPANKVFLSATLTITNINKRVCGMHCEFVIILSKLNLKGNLLLFDINLPRIQRWNKKILEM